jgi:hypothetical protein
VLLDVLSSGRADITKAMTSDELKRDRELSAELASLNTQLIRLKTQSKSPAAQMADVQTRLDKTRLEYEAFQASLYAAHLELKVQRGETQPLTLDEASALLPDDQTAILEYVVTEEKSYLFVLRKAPKAARDKAVELTVHTLNVKSTDLAQMAQSLRSSAQACGGRTARRAQAPHRTGRRTLECTIPGFAPGRARLSPGTVRGGLRAVVERTARNGKKSQRAQNRGASGSSSDTPRHG